MEAVCGFWISCSLCINCTHEAVQAALRWNAAFAVCGFGISCSLCFNCAHTAWQEAFRWKQVAASGSAAAFASIARMRQCRRHLDGSSLCINCAHEAVQAAFRWKQVAASGSTAAFASIARMRQCRWHLDGSRRPWCLNKGRLGHEHACRGVQATCSAACTAKKAGQAGCTEEQHHGSQGAILLQTLINIFQVFACKKDQEAVRLAHIQKIHTRLHPAGGVRFRVIFFLVLQTRGFLKAGRVDPRDHGVFFGQC
eukprot:1151269-Pelagomonas_calceolata.AAC.2